MSLHSVSTYGKKILLAEFNNKKVYTLHGGLYHIEEYCEHDTTNRSVITA